LRKRKDGGLSLTTITKMLENVKTPMTFTKLRMTSTPLEHRGFIKYLNFCTSKNLMNRRMLTYNEYHESISHSKYYKHNRSIEPYRPLYLLSEKGRGFLEMVG